MAESLEYIIRVRGGAEGAAEVRKVDDALGRQAGHLKQVGKESEKANRGLTAASGGVKSLGKALFAAGAGFVAFEAGKKSFEFTHELLVSTKQLTSAFGLSTAEASRWAGVTAAVGGNAGQSAMAFQKVSKAAETQIQHSKKQVAAHEVLNTAVISGIAPLEKLGLSSAYLEKHQKNLGPVMETIVDRIHHLGNVTERGSILSTLFGRGWKQLSPILLEGKQHLDDLLGTAKEMGVELHGNTGQALEEFREKQIRAKLATEGLQLRFTELAAKPIGDLLSGFSSLALALQKGDWKDFDKQAQRIGDTFTNLAEKVLPHVAESFAHMAPAVLRGFVKGFLHASVGGQAVIAAVLLTKLGITKAIFAGAGKTMFGALVSSWMGPAAAGEVATAGATLGAAFEVAFVAAAAVGIAILAKKLEHAIEHAKTQTYNEHGEPTTKAEADAEAAADRSRFDKSFRSPAERKAFKEGGPAFVKYVKAHPRDRHANRPDLKAGHSQPSHPHNVRASGASAGHVDAALVRDVHVHVDGRKLFTINARQALQAQGAGE